MHFNFRFLNDKELKDDAHFKLSCKDGTYRVDISDVNEDMAGKIKVVAKNQNGEAVSQVIMNKIVNNYINVNLIKQKVQDVALVYAEVAEDHAIYSGHCLNIFWTNTYKVVLQVCFSSHSMHIL